MVSLPVCSALHAMPSTRHVWTPGVVYAIKGSNRDGRRADSTRCGCGKSFRFSSILFQFFFNSCARVVRWEMPMPPESSYSAVPVRLDLANARLWYGDQARVLRPKTFALLRYLVAHPGQVLTKAALLEAVWPETTVSEVVLAVCIRELRQALGDDAKTPRFIETMHRRGYRFIGHLPTVHPSAPHTAAAAPPPLLVGRAQELDMLYRGLATALTGV